MKQLKELNQIVGKIIARAKFTSWEGLVGIFFTDDTFVVFESDQDYDGALDLIISKEIDDLSILLELGAITDEECLRKQDKLDEDFAKNLREEEINIYKELRTKYGDREI